MASNIFETLPAGIIYIAVVLVLLVSCEIGYRLGDRARSRQDKEAPASLAPMVGGLLGMLAFVLAFTFSIAAQLHELRKQNVLNEANVVGTAYLRSELLPDQHGAVIRKLLREYVEIRLAAARGENLEAALERSVAIHGLLWNQAVAAALEQPTTNTSMVVQSINDVIDMHQTRITAALQNRIPGSIWIALAVISILTMMTIGTQVGLSGKRRLIAVIPLSLALTALVILVVDLDRPGSGLISVGQQAMIELQGSFGL
jgi:hypothetical protein